MLIHTILLTEIELCVSPFCAGVGESDIVLKKKKKPQTSHWVIYLFQVLRSSCLFIAAALNLFRCPRYLEAQVGQWSAGRHTAETHLKGRFYTVIYHMWRTCLFPPPEFCFWRATAMFVAHAATPTPLKAIQEKKKKMNGIPAAKARMMATQPMM